MPDNSPDHNNELFDTVSGTSISGLKKGFGKAEGITPNQEARLDRKGELDLRDTKRSIQKLKEWSIFGLSLLMGSSFCVGFIWLCVHYMLGEIQAGNAGEIVKMILTFLFGTLAAELWRMRKSLKP